MCSRKFPLNYLSCLFYILKPQDATIRSLFYTFFKKNPVVCANFPLGSKFHFSKWKTYFTQFIDKFLKFEEMEYLIHHVKVEMWPALCKFPILFSPVKLKLGRNFSQFIYRSKLVLLNLEL